MVFILIMRSDYILYCNSHFFPEINASNETKLLEKRGSEIEKPTTERKSMTHQHVSENNAITKNSHLSKLPDVDSE